MATTNKKSLPVHHSQMLSDTGVTTKIITKDSNHNPVSYTHCDDYYLFALIIDGELQCKVDFKNFCLRSGDIHFIRPGQVHQYLKSSNLEGWMMMAEKNMVDNFYRMIFDKASILGLSPDITNEDFELLKSMFTVINNIEGKYEDRKILQNLVSAYIGLFVDKFKRNIYSRLDNDRQMDIILKFNSLLESDIAISHSPSYYADKLNISTVYLNEIVNNIAATSSSNYIRNEIVLRAKRLLYNTDMTVKEIAYNLGFEDNAYFTRIFSKTAGLSPSEFRSKK